MCAAASTSPPAERGWNWWYQLSMSVPRRAIFLRDGVHATPAKPRQRSTTRVGRSTRSRTATTLSPASPRPWPFNRPVPERVDPTPAPDVRELEMPDEAGAPDRREMVPERLEPHGPRKRSGAPVDQASGCRRSDTGPGTWSRSARSRRTPRAGDPRRPPLHQGCRRRSWPPPPCSHSAGGPRR